MTIAFNNHSYHKLFLPAVASGVPTLDTIHHCDAMTLLRALPSGSIDMILTSPPYDNLRKYNGYSWSFEPIAHEMYRVLKSGGVAVWVVGDSVVDGSETLSSFKQALYFKEQAGFRMQDTMIWRKCLPGNYGKRYMDAFEYMFVLSKGEPNVFNPMMRKNKTAGQTAAKGTRLSYLVSGRIIPELSILENVWDIPIGFNHTTRDIVNHPAMFPEELARRHIATWSNPGDTVLDPFMGSGTTAKMARNLGRHYLGCDISSEYVALAKRRLSDSDPYQATVLSTGAIQHSLFAAVAS